MARVEIPRTDLPGPFSTTGQALNMVAADQGDGNFIQADTVLLIADNRDAGAQTVTIASTPEQSTGRTGDVSAQSLAANEVRVFQLQINGWAQSNNEINVNGSSANIFFGVVRNT